MPTVANTQQTARPRVLWLDYAKAVGIFFVVWEHALVTNPQAAWAARIDPCINAFHMPLFFALSGSALWYRWRQTERLHLKSEVRHRVARLLVPYGFWAVAYTILKGFVNICRAENVWDGFLADVVEGITGVMAPMWFLCTLFFAEVLFATLWQWMKAKRMDASLLMWGGVALLLLLATVLLCRVNAHLAGRVQVALLPELMMTAFRTIPALFYTVVGYMAMLAAHRAPSFLKTNAAMAFMLAASLLLFLAAVSRLNGKIIFRLFVLGGNVWLSVFAALAGTAAVILAARLLPAACGPLAKFGRGSMHIMLFHAYPFPFQKANIVLWERLVGPSVRLGPAMLTLLETYLFSVYVFAPLCRRAKARFDAHAR